MESQSSGRCAQCSDTRNLYIKTCQCSKEASFTPKPVNGKGCVQSDSKSSTLTVDTKKESTVTTETSKFKAVKAVVHKVIKVYESRSPNTMKYIAVVSALILFFGILSLVLAQRDESAQSKYGMAFALGEAAASSDEKRVSVGVPGEEQQPTVASNEAVTTTTSSSPAASSSEDTTSPATAVPDAAASQNKPESGDNQNEGEINPAILIAGDDDEKHEEGDQNPRIVFIERLMGLHVSAPANRGEGQPNEPPKDASQEQSQNAIKNPLDKVNAKWASRMRKFSIPIPQEGGPNLMQPPVQENPMLRYAAAAMMSRLVAAAARAQMEAQAREAMLARAKDKDDENEDGTVPVIVATVRDNQQGPQVRPIPPMYGRPMPRPQIVRHPIIPYNVVPQQPRQMPSMPHRAYIAPPQRPPMAAPTLQRRVAPPPQPVLLMVAVPLQSSESRQSQMHINPMISQRPSMPFYPSVPYNVPLIYRHQPQPASTIAMPVQIPVPAHIQTPYLQRQMLNIPIQQRQVAAFSHIRPVVEVPVEVPVPYHYPVPIAVRQFGQHQNNDQDASGSEPDHMILLYDAEIQHEDGEDLDSSASEGHEQHMRGGPKAHQFLARPLPQTASPGKLKLWRELAGAKYAAQSGVRYIPVAVATNDEPSAANSQFAARNGFQQRLHAQESIGQPAFIVLAEPESH